MPAVFRLVMGLVLLMGAGATGWLTWLLWDEAPIADTVADHPSETAAPSTAVSAPVIDPLTQESANKRPEQLEAERLERERQAAKKRLAELQREAERLERERQAAEKRLAEQREAERLARERRAAEKRLAEQREAERLARERQAAEKRLAEQREAERLERERQAAEKRLVEQREAERELAKRPEAIRQANKISNNATQRIVPSVPKTRDRLYPDAELQAKRAAALEAWNKANSGMGWAEDIEGEDESD
jgi:predicted  nucleic acid-binding Zn-ribbon protein